MLRGEILLSLTAVIGASCSFVTGNPVGEELLLKRNVLCASNVKPVKLYAESASSSSS